MLDYITRNEDRIIDVMDKDGNIVFENAYKAYREQTMVDSSPFAFLFMNTMEYIAYEDDSGRIYMLKPNEVIVTRRPTVLTK